MIGGVESGICPVDRVKKRQEMHSAEKSVERTLQHQRQPLQIATESINVGDELNLILHNRALLASEAHYDRGEMSLAQTTILKGPRLRRQAYCQ